MDAFNQKRNITLIFLCVFFSIIYVTINLSSFFPRPTSLTLANKYFEALRKRDKKAINDLVEPSCIELMDKRSGYEMAAISNVIIKDKNIRIEKKLFHYPEKIWIDFKYRFSIEKEWKNGKISLLSDFDKKEKKRFLCGEDPSWVSQWPKEAAKAASYALIASGVKHMEKANKLAQKDKTMKNLIAEEVQASIHDLKQAIMLTPDLSIAWFYLGRTYRDLIDIAEDSDKWAIESYKKAIELEPKYALAHMDLGGVYFRINEYRLAVQEFEDYIKLVPYDPNGYYNLGYTYRRMGKSDNANQAFHQALKLLKSNSDDYKKILKEINSL